MAIVEVEDEVPTERTNAVALEDVAGEGVAPLVVVVALEEVAALVVVGRRRKSSVFCFFDESIFPNVYFGGMVLGFERLSSKFSLGVERQRREGDRSRRESVYLRATRTSPTADVAVGCNGRQNTVAASESLVSTLTRVSCLEGCAPQ